MFKFTYLTRPNYIVVQVVNDTAILGSFNIEPEDLDFMQEIAEFMERKQKENSEKPHTRIN